MDSDWDLHAVVRGCSSAVSSGVTSAGTWPLDVHSQQKSTFLVDNNNLMGFFFTDIFQPRNDNSIEQFLNDPHDPFRFQKPQNTPRSPSLPISPLSVLGGLQDPSYHQQKQSQGKQQSFGISRCTTSHAQSTTKVKKRKNQTKRVCQVPAEGSSSDLWSWRKYGQKPIKGAPYPRGYYKCSTSKGCMARKQVERNRSDPGMLIVTYTGDHTHPMPTHRNSLAGGSRSKPTTSGEDDTNNSKPTSSPVSPATTLSPATEKTEENERDDTDDDNNFAVSDVVMEEDFFDGLDELVGSTTGDSFFDHLPLSTAALPFSWLSNNVDATTTTATVAGGS